MVPFRAHIIIFLAVLPVLLAACPDSSPIPVGFAGPLTGKLASLGVPARNGAQLAIEIVNEKNGIEGRPLLLLSKDDGNTPAQALQVDKELAKAGAVAVIGHISGSLTKAVLPFFNEQEIALIAPDGAPPELTGKKDQFFQVACDYDVRSRELADYAKLALNVRTVVTLAETDHGDYTLPLAQNFAKNFKALGGNVLGDLTYSTKNSLDWETVIQQLIVLKPQAILLLCPAYDAVSLVQRLHANQLNIQILIGAWAYSDKLLLWGRTTMEGVVIALDYAEDNPNPEFIKFREAYRHRFGENPNHSAAFGYEAVLALATALRTTHGRADGLAEALADGRTVQGVVGKFILDEYGDARRNIFIITVLDGKYSTVSVR